MQLQNCPISSATTGRVKILPVSPGKNLLDPFRLVGNQRHVKEPKSFETRIQVPCISYVCISVILSKIENFQTFRLPMTNRRSLMFIGNSMSITLIEVTCNFEDLLSIHRCDHASPRPGPHGCLVWKTYNSSINVVEPFLRINFGYWLCCWSPLIVQRSNLKDFFIPRVKIPS